MNTATNWLMFRVQDTGGKAPAKEWEATIKEWQDETGAMLARVLHMSTPFQIMLSLPDEADVKQAWNGNNDLQGAVAITHPRGLDIKLDCFLPFDGVFVSRRVDGLRPLPIVWSSWLCEAPGVRIVRPASQNQRNKGIKELRVGLPGGNYVRALIGKNMQMDLTGLEKKKVGSWQLDAEQSKYPAWLLERIGQPKATWKDVLENPPWGEIGESDQDDLDHRILMTFPVWLKYRVCKVLLSALPKDLRKTMHEAGGDACASQIFAAINKVFRRLGDRLVPLSADERRAARRRGDADDGFVFVEPNNPVDLAARLTRVKRLQMSRHAMEEIPAEFRQNHPSFMGRLCPVESPESELVGLSLQLAQGAKIDKEGFILQADEENSAVMGYRANLGWGAGLIPLFQHNDGTRNMMGAKNLRQVLPPVENREAPAIKSGGERDVLKFMERLTRIGVCPDVADENGEMAMGRDLLVAYMPWYGWNMEDAIVIGKHVVDDHRFDVAVTKRVKKHVRPGWHPQGEFKHALDIRKALGDAIPDDASSLEGNGLAAKGTILHAGDVIVRLVSSTGPHVTEIRYKDASPAVVKEISCPAPKQKWMGGTLEYVLEKHIPLRLGDKLMGRHGNKGVIGRIEETDKMPRLPDDERLPAAFRNRPVDIILNPHGVISRMNIGQLLETHLGWLAHAGNCRMEDFMPAGCQAAEIGIPAVGVIDHEKVRNQLEKTGLDRWGRIQLVLPDGEPTKSPVVVGFEHIVRLKHIPELKSQARGGGPACGYDARTGQAIHGRVRGGGQRVGEMEVWALAAHQAECNLAEMLGGKADAVWARDWLSGNGHGEAETEEGFPRQMKDWLFAIGIDMARDETGKICFSLCTDADTIRKRIDGGGRPHEGVSGGGVAKVQTASFACGLKTQKGECGYVFPLAELYATDKGCLRFGDVLTRIGYKILGAMAKTSGGYSAMLESLDTGKTDGQLEIVFDDYEPGKDWLKFHVSPGNGVDRPSKWPKKLNEIYCYQRFAANKAECENGVAIGRNVSAAYLKDCVTTGKWKWRNSLGTQHPIADFNVTCPDHSTIPIRKRIDGDGRPHEVKRGDGVVTGPTASFSCCEKNNKGECRYRFPLDGLRVSYSKKAKADEKGSLRVGDVLSSLGYKIAGPMIGAGNDYTATLESLSTGQLDGQLRLLVKDYDESKDWLKFHISPASGENRPSMWPQNLDNIFCAARFSANNAEKDGGFATSKGNLLAGHLKEYVVSGRGRHTLADFIVACPSHPTTSLSPVPPFKERAFALPGGLFDEGTFGPLNNVLVHARDEQWGYIELPFDVEYPFKAFLRGKETHSNWTAISSDWTMLFPHMTLEALKEKIDEGNVLSANMKGRQIGLEFHDVERGRTKARSFKSFPMTGCPETCDFGDDGADLLPASTRGAGLSIPKSKIEKAICTFAVLDSGHIKAVTIEFCEKNGNVFSRVAKVQVLNQKCDVEFPFAFIDDKGTIVYTRDQKDTIASEVPQDKKAKVRSEGEYKARLRSLLAAQGYSVANDRLDQTLKVVPVLPVRYRLPLMDREVDDKIVTEGYRPLLDACQAYRRLEETKNPKEKKKHEKRLEFAKACISQAVENLFYLLICKMEGKFGIVRRNGLGRRVDRSSRLVITPKPELEWNQVGIPPSVLWELMGDKVLSWMKENSLGKDDWDRLEDLISGRANLSEKAEGWSWLRSDKDAQVLGIVAGNLHNYLAAHPETLVLLNRQPSLHKDSFQAFHPVVLDPEAGEVFQLSPLCCKGLGADFDGDEMVGHYPVSDAAQKEAARMLPDNNLLSSATQKEADRTLPDNNLLGTSLAHFDQDFVMGSYWMPEFPDIMQKLEELLPGDCCLKEKFIAEHGVRHDKQAGGELLDHICRAHPDKAIHVVSEWLRLALDACSRMGVSFGFYDLLEMAEKVKDVCKTAGRSNDAVQEVVTAELENFLRVADNATAGLHVAGMAISGARGKKQIRQLIGVRGQLDPGALGYEMSVADRTDKFWFATPLTEGMVWNAAFYAAMNSRSSMCDKKLGTGHAGALTRKLVFALWPFKIVTDDCGSDATCRSVVTCKAHGGFCAKCYGALPNGELPSVGYPAGLIAAQSIGERGTQLSMQSFHTGTRAFDMSVVRSILSGKDNAHYFDGIEKASAFVARFKNEPASAYHDLLDRHFELLWRVLFDNEKNSLGGVIDAHDAITSLSYSRQAVNLLLAAMIEKEVEIGTSPIAEVLFNNFTADKA